MSRPELLAVFPLVYFPLFFLTHESYCLFLARHPPPPNVGLAWRLLLLFFFLLNCTGAAQALEQFSTPFFFLFPSELRFPVPPHFFSLLGRFSPAFYRSFGEVNRFYLVVFFFLYLAHVPFHIQSAAHSASHLPLPFGNFLHLFPVLFLYPLQLFFSPTLHYFPFQPSSFNAPLRPPSPYFFLIPSQTPLHMPIPLSSQLPPSYILHTLPSPSCISPQHLYFSPPFPPPQSHLPCPTAPTILLIPLSLLLLSILSSLLPPASAPPPLA